MKKNARLISQKMQFSPEFSIYQEEMDEIDQQANEVFMNIFFYILLTIVITIGRWVLFNERIKEVK